MKTRTILFCAGIFIHLAARTLHGDTFGSGTNTFTIDFVTVGNPGNADDAGAGGGIYSSPYGGVSYVFRMGTYEISQDMITKATDLGMENVTAGGWPGSLPAVIMEWYEAAAFVNWLNTSTGRQPAYNLAWNDSSWSLNLWGSGDAWQLGGENRYRHKDAYYFLPSEDEWYKAAYHQNDGVTANYWDYPTVSNAVPDGIDSDGDPSYDAVFHDIGGYYQPTPNAITSVGSASSAYGTYGQGGNVTEWTESALDGSNNSPSELRAIRGGWWSDPEIILRPTGRGGDIPGGANGYTGFRVASILEPSVPLLSAIGVNPGGFGFTITGVVNQTIVVQASTNLVNWQPIWTNTLTAVATNFVDPDWLNHPHRFYRAQSY